MGKSARNAPERQNWCRNRSVNGAENPLGMPGRNTAVTVTGKNIFSIRERQCLSIRGQCNTHCIVLNMPTGVNMQLCIQYARWISRLGIDAIIPVPLHRKRRRERGYNQAELFAKEIGKRTGIPVETKLLYRCINTRPQKELNDQERKKNLKKAFTIAQNIVQLRKVLLVDDIYTTGSTVDAAAECLKVSGIQEVYVLCISIGRGH